VSVFRNHGPCQRHGGLRPPHADDHARHHQYSRPRVKPAEDGHSCGSPPWPRSGAADAERDVRGCALKFYTEEATGPGRNNNAGFFLCATDQVSLTSFTRQKRTENQSRSQHGGLDFWSLRRNRCISDDSHVGPRSAEKPAPCQRLRQPHLQFINAQNERFWVKFPFQDAAGIQFMTNEEAAAVSPGTARVRSAICSSNRARANFPWNPGPDHAEKDAETYRWNPFDLTKVWPHQDYPVIDAASWS